MNTNDVIINSWQHTFRTLENREEDEAKIIATFGEPLQVTMEKLFPNVPVEESIQVYRSYHYDNFGELISLFPGMKELIAELKKRGYKLGMVTSRLRRTTEQGMEKYGIMEYFDTVVTADDTDKHRPDPEPDQYCPGKAGRLYRKRALCWGTPCSISSARKMPASSRCW